MKYEKNKCDKGILIECNFLQKSLSTDVNKAVVVSLPVAIVTPVSIITSQLLSTEVWLETIMQCDTFVPYPPSKAHQSVIILALHSCISCKINNNKINIFKMHIKIIIICDAALQPHSCTNFPCYVLKIFVYFLVSVICVFCVYRFSWTASWALAFFGNLPPTITHTPI